MPSALAMRYARALADVVTKPGSPVNAEAVVAEIGGFTRLLDEAPAIRTALESPAVAPPRKRAVVGRLAKQIGLSDVVRRFLFVVIDHRRTALLGEVSAAFESVMDERLGIARAEVASARPLDERQRQEIIAGLAKLTGRQARAQFRIDKDLIGGVTARVGSTVYDGSIRGQLEGLRQRLAGVES
jgi:F-type H+-transporting ATPase subunit delta